jgi:hypothetical protein
MSAGESPVATELICKIDAEILENTCRYSVGDYYRLKGCLNYRHRGKII